MRLRHNHLQVVPGTARFIVDHMFRRKKYLYFFRTVVRKQFKKSIHVHWIDLSIQFELTNINIHKHFKSILQREKLIFSKENKNSLKHDLA